MIRLFRRELFSAFFDWLEVNKDSLGKLYSQLYNEGKKAEDIADNAINVMAVAMWMFNMIANCGVLCGIGPDGPAWDNLTIAEGLDEKSTKSLLIHIAACINLQYLPPEITKQEIPVIFFEEVQP